MGEPPLLLHEWFAAVAPSTLAGDRELAIILYGRVEANAGEIDDRPSALQLVKRLGTDTFRTVVADEARTVKLVGLLARDRAVAAGVDEVVINTFKTGISPHYEFLLRAAREQKPHKVNLRAAFPPRPRSVAPETIAAEAPPPVRESAAVPSTLLDLGSDYQRPAGAPGSMHELAEGLRRARQLRRPISAQRLADKVSEPKVLPDRDASRTPSRGRSSEAQQQSPSSAVAAADVPKEASGRAEVKVMKEVGDATDGPEASKESEPMEAAQQPVTANSAAAVDSPMMDAHSESAQSLPIDVQERNGDVPIAEEEVVAGDSPSRVEEDEAAKFAPHPAAKEDEAVTASSTQSTVAATASASPDLVKIDCRPKSVKQVLAVTVLRFFLDSRTATASNADTRMSASAPASIASGSSSQRAQSLGIEGTNGRTHEPRPRRLSGPISRFQANMASIASLSQQLSQHTKEQVSPDTTTAPTLPAEAVPTSAETSAVEPMEVDVLPRAVEEEELRRSEPLPAETGPEMAHDASSAADLAVSEEQPTKLVNGASSVVEEARSGAFERNAEIEKATPVAAASSPTNGVQPAPKPRTVSLARVEPPSSDRHSSMDPIPIRSSQGFSSMYGDDSEHEEEHASADASANEISAFLERDLASSVVDEEDFAGRSERPPAGDVEDGPVAAPTEAIVMEATDPQEAERSPAETPADQAHPPLHSPRASTSQASSEHRLFENGFSDAASRSNTPSRHMEDSAGAKPSPAELRGTVPVAATAEDLASNAAESQEVERLLSAEPSARDQSPDQSPPSLSPWPTQQNSPNAAGQSDAASRSGTPSRHEEPPVGSVLPAVSASVSVGAENSPLVDSEQRLPAAAPEQSPSPPALPEQLPTEDSRQHSPTVDELPTRDSRSPGRVTATHNELAAAEATTSQESAAALSVAAAAESIAAAGSNSIDPASTAVNAVENSPVRAEKSFSELFPNAEEPPENETHYAPLEDKDQYFAEVAEDGTESLVNGAEVKQEVVPDEPLQLAGGSAAGRLGEPFAYQAHGNLPFEAYDPSATTGFEPDSASQAAVDLDGITDPGALEALAALRSSPSTPQERAKTSRPRATKASPKRATPRRARTTPATGTKRKAVASPAQTAAAASARPASASPSKKPATQYHDFVLEIFPLPKSPKKRTQPKAPPAVATPDPPVASTSKVTLDDEPAQVSAPASPKGLSSVQEMPERAPSPQVAEVVAETDIPPRQTASPPAPLHLEPVRHETNDYESDSDDPLAAPVPQAKSRLPKGNRKQMAKRSRPLPGPSRLPSEDSEDEAESRAIAQKLLATGPAARKSLDPSGRIARPAPPTKRRLSENAILDDATPKKQRVGPGTEPHRRPSLAGKGQPSHLQNGLTRVRPPANGAHSSPLPRTSAPLVSKSGHQTAARSVANEHSEAVPSASKAVGRKVQKRRRSDIEDDGSDEGDFNTPDRRGSQRGHSRPKSTHQVPPTQQRQSQLERSSASARSEEPAHPAENGSDLRHRLSPSASPAVAAEDDFEIEEEQSAADAEDVAPVEVKTPAKPRKRPKKRKSITMPRFKGRKRATPRQQRPPSPTPEETASPEPTPTQHTSSARGSSAKGKHAGGSARGSKRARQAYDEDE
ncbi:hypothetical protein JCM10908_004623 [Rhodotorula pacifica]|uniref:uncharacterized protein n=1 Tax=Rhodotorula pacifica TaxID=1495444 RepID=UPI0031806FB2